MGAPVTGCGHSSMALCEELVYLRVLAGAPANLLIRAADPPGAVAAT